MDVVERSNCHKKDWTKEAVYEAGKFVLLTREEYSSYHMFGFARILKTFTESQIPTYTGETCHGNLRVPEEYPDWKALVALGFIEEIEMPAELWIGSDLSRDDDV